MLKRISRPKRPKDVNQRAHALVDESTESGETDPNTNTLPSREQISLLMAVMGRKGGKIGGKRRLQTMTPSARRRAARKAARVRWSKPHQNFPDR
jgi:hypothetical protein